jgi:deoxyribodipyrimidine photo-lyase
MARCQLTEISATSQESVRLRGFPRICDFGTLSPREVFFRGGEASATVRQSIASYVNELIWREFYMQILAHFPRVLNSDLSDEFPGLAWDDNESAFRCWCEGSTGSAIVESNP